MIYTEAETDLIVADSFKELNYKQKKLFLASVREENADRQKYADALIKICGAGVYNKLKDRFQSGDYRGGILAFLEKKRITCVTVKSESYPERLRNIPTPPLVLYARGNVRLLSKPMLGVVGARKTLPQMAEECRGVCDELAEKLVIVTGIADGADSAAARGALASGNIICVLPEGHDSAGVTNAKLLREVEENGLSISEFPVGTRAQRYTFILRNRIIAGLSLGVLVVSAAEKSGALSTASYAADYSRDVMAFPYGIGVTSGAGCNNLIKNGAYLCESAADVFNVLGIEHGERQQIELDGDEKILYDLLKEEGELHAEKLAGALKKSLTEVTTICAMLEIKGLVVRTGGNKFAAV